MLLFVWKISGGGGGLRRVELKEIGMERERNELGKEIYHVFYKRNYQKLKTEEITGSNFFDGTYVFYTAIVVNESVARLTLW